MELFYYIFLWGAVLLGGLLFKRTRTRNRVLPYMGLSVLFFVVAVALYLAVSQWAGIIRLGEAAERNIPQDYFKHGLGGFAAFLILVLGMLSPLGAAVITGRLKTGRNISSISRE